MANGTLYVKHESGAIHAISGRRFKKLRRAVVENTAGPEVTALVEAGYIGFLASDGEVYDFEALSPAAMGV